MKLRFLLLAMSISLLFSCSNNSGKETTEKPKEHLTKAQKDSIKLEKDIKSYYKSVPEKIAFYKNYNPDKYSTDVETMSKEIRGFESDVLLATKSFKHGKDSLKELSTELRGLIKKTQIKALPIYRKAYGKISGQVLWRENIDVKIKGKNNEKIIYTGGLFASNANIEDFYKQLKEVYHLYRFKEAGFKWYENADMTYYSIKSRNDEDI
jgi:hypothetical protein